MKIRDANLRDLAILADVHARAFARSWNEDALAALMKAPGVLALLAELEEPCAFVLMRIAADEAEILTLAVSPDARRNGVASGLLEQAAHRAMEHGAARLFLEVAMANMPARNLYGKYGFDEVGPRKGYYEDGDDALTLAASLPLALRMGNSAKTL
ncbi:MAG: ribosomal protein S18-alanine N-acetyltransferase [Rhizomicrobium sp.]